MTIIVNWIVSFFVGHETFLSSFTSSLAILFLTIGLFIYFDISILTHTYHIAEIIEYSLLSIKNALFG